MTAQLALESMTRLVGGIETCSILISGAVRSGELSRVEVAYDDAKRLNDEVCAAAASVMARHPCSTLSAQAADLARRAGYHLAEATAARLHAWGRRARRSQAPKRQ